MFKIAALTNKQGQLRFHQHLPSSNINIYVSVTGDRLQSSRSHGRADRQGSCLRCWQRAGEGNPLNGRFVQRRIPRHAGIGAARRQPRRHPLPGPRRRRAAERRGAPRGGAGLSGCVPRGGEEHCCQKAREPQSILRTDFEAHIVFIWMLLLKKSLACFLVKQFAEMFPLLLQLRPETDRSAQGA